MVYVRSPGPDRIMEAGALILTVPVTDANTNVDGTGVKEIPLGKSISMLAPADPSVQLARTE